MSISGALSNALSGLTASSRLADVAASNIANAMTDGYGVRSAILTPRVAGDEGGVSVVGIQRLVNPVLIADRRSAEAEMANSEISQGFFSRMQVQTGLPTDAGSLSDRLAELETALVEATRSPESEPTLQNVQSALENLTTKLNDLGDRVQAERVRADQSIATEVQNVNDALSEIEDLNATIKRMTLFDHDVSAMLDQRQTLIDYVNERIPVTELDRGYGTVALMASGGVMLIDGKASELEFTSSSVITADMSLAGGTLSELTINGRAVDTSRNPSPISGGSIDALFEVRDESSVEYQAKLDGFAMDLIERFEDPAVDPTRAATDPGLFTDNGALLDPSLETGLAQRISINALVDPDQGGEVWRLRDGLGSVTPGSEGQTAGLLRLYDALTTAQNPTSTAFNAGARSSATLAAALSSHLGSKLESAEGTLSFSRTQYETLKELELAEGVDTDAEVQRLLIIEQAYAANARVVEVIDEMLDWLMRI